ncbi:Gfo/Idh/MocA family protein [Stagnihabitans tardus]|uniref:Gfo/Idh/MocA family oxidoreductase n=1 Tax=Stagnihabitans tardus TaxID=2699202 RepID=A0AAE4YBX9_9RHOB|nr:Gfo/Idh/MocA family oxidoreductase [Stagnihabitans tardus]NBZ89836.1 Gfo/Idh/MocA family oxidoreductase [Stagnihabitans tardus]
MEIGAALIGTGFMGKAHALAYRNVRAVMGDLPGVRLVTLVDTPEAKAEAMAAQFGFEAATADWRAVLTDPRVQLVSITTPNGLHREMAEACLAAGKHVWCEKPMALTLEDARSMVEAARARGLVTQLGYNYTANPAFIHACRLVAGGEIGRVVQVRGWVDEDYQADPDLPWSRRAKVQDAGLGALGDIGCHLISLLTGLAGPLDSVVGEMETIHKTRPLPDGSGRAEVENEDCASALLTFASGVKGTFTASRSAWGRKSRLGFEVHGTEGMVIYDQERMNELQLYQNRGDRAKAGFVTILTSPEHAPYGAFCPAPGHQLGFNDLKVIEAAGLLRAIRDGGRAPLDFTAGLEIEKAIHAIALSAREGRRVRLGEVWAPNPQPCAAFRKASYSSSLTGTTCSGAG